jgi:hypothetical protein
MRLRHAAVARAALPALLWGIAFVGGAVGASAQPADGSGLPRSFGPQVGKIGTDTNLVTSAANEHGSYLWIVDPIQHTVTLCVQADPARDFKCNKKPLP